ncbi:E3 ubiquitin-protein ligase SIN-like [Parasponia andersonii]|uniref:E3 ubiquitin-protein ligase SIN-like n=1 Tax=Parasponia andersonii TaxID=3476 RepID=A0A2P5DVY2_PARAD|nr:E3 ubiquitin-protein ligase SIN-like [Parasponia andersonii]
MVKGNGEEHTLYVSSGGNSRKKKKQQLTTPRPACSWVYFSREFIKDYSASHPESSGLKAATKAASVVWKSMSLEDKAKYTTRARQVWDNYLSAAPASASKPRKQTKLVTRCSPGRLFNVLQRLTVEQKDAVKSMGFGSLLGLRCRTLRRSLCLWLLERFNATQCSLEICGNYIPLTPKDVEFVMGLAASGKDVVNSGPDDSIADLRHSYNATNRGISVRLLEERLAVPEAGEDFKRTFVLYSLGILLCPTARLDVSPSFLHFLKNMSVVHQFNWGKFLLDRLVREVSRFHQGKQRTVGGCLLFLQLLYYERISIEGTGALAPAVCPCLSLWGEDEITEREKQERELGGYGCGQVIFKERGPVVESFECRDQLDNLPAGNISNGIEHDPFLLHKANQADGERMNGEVTIQEDNMPIFLKGKDVVCGDIELIVESVRKPCRNKEYGCNEIVDYMKNSVHEETCLFAPCACPLPDCNVVGSSQQLSLHFSSKHWDSGRRFRYNSPLAVSLNMNEQFLVLQAEDDGALFLINKGIESIGSTVMITCIASSSSKRRFVYDLVLKRGSSTLRLNSLAECFPGRVEGFPPMDFLLVPFHFVNSSGQLNLNVCISNSRGTE